MKKVAVVGAGFCGLAMCWHLLQLGARVTLFDKQGVGAGASGIATGLMHPYPGEVARRSWRADEGIAATRALLHVASQGLGRPVALDNGILRYALNDEQREAFAKRAAMYGDMEQIAQDVYLIRSGMTVHAMPYLEGLFQACAAKGATLSLTHIETLEQLKDYDQIVLAAGHGMFSFPECAALKLKAIKGQLLKCKWPAFKEPLERSLIGKGYVAVSESSEYCYLGATFEKQFADVLPNLKVAKEDLIPKISMFFPEASRLEIVDCLAGIRVANSSGQYQPIICRLTKNCFAITAMGSRGLLYHALLSAELAAMMSLNIPNVIR